MRVYRIYAARRDELVEVMRKEGEARLQRVRSHTLAQAERRFDAAARELTEANLLFLHHCEQHHCVRD